MSIRALALAVTFAVCASLCVLIFWNEATPAGTEAAPVPESSGRADLPSQSDDSNRSGPHDAATTEVSRRSIDGSSNDRIVDLARGRVVQHDGDGVANVTVQFSTVFAPHHRFQVTTDAAGRFELRGALPSPAYFDIQVQDGADARRRFERLDEQPAPRLPTRPDDADLWIRVRELPPPPTLVGRLLDARDGSAVPNVRVELERAGNVLAYVVTANDGAFDFVRSGEPLVDWYVRVAPTATHRGARFGPFSFDDVRRELRLEPALRLPIRVTAADTLAPVDRYRVRIRPVDLPPAATTDARTTSAPFVDGRCEVWELWSGESMLQIVPDDPLLAMSDVLRVDPRNHRQDAPLEIRLARLLPLRAHVRRSDGRPRADVEVELVQTPTYTRAPFATDARTRVLAARSKSLDRVPTIVSRAMTDAAGACDLGVPVGADGLQLRVRKVGGPYQITPIPVPAPRAFDLVFDSPSFEAFDPRQFGIVEGELRGASATTWQWTVDGKRDGGKPDDWTAQTPDAAGRFEFEQPAGRYRVRAEATQSPAIEGRRVISVGSTAPVSFDVVAGETRRLVIDTPEPARITGQVSFEKGELDGDEVVGLYTESLSPLASTRVDAEGRFEFANVFPNERYCVCLEAGSRRERAVWNPAGIFVEVRPGKTVDIDLRVREREARITLRDPHGRPAVSQRLTVACGPVLDFVDTDASGVAIVRNLPLRGRLRVLQTREPELELAEVKLQPDVFSYAVAATLGQPLRPNHPSPSGLLINPDLRNR